MDLRNTNCDDEVRVQKGGERGNGRAGGELWGAKLKRREQVGRNWSAECETR